MNSSIATEIELDQPQEEAVGTVEQALAGEGFGVLTRIDLDKAFEEKLGESFRPYAILGACNPSLALRAVNAEPEIGLLLACNVTVEAVSETKSKVRIIDPGAMLSFGNLGDNPAVGEVAAEASEKLQRVAASLQRNR
ncbi:MAG: DUF302 domain-containing protein [Gemmatimonadota bacterium]